MKRLPAKVARGRLPLDREPSFRRAGTSPREATKVGRSRLFDAAGLPDTGCFAKLIRMRSIPFLALIVACVASGDLTGTAFAQEAPAPDAIPVPPVATETLPAPPPMVFTGPAVALDGMTVQISDRKLLLYGIMTADVRLPDGLRARLALDRLIAGRSDVVCTEMPRDEGFRRRAVCLSGEIDLAEALLAEGAGFVDRFQTQSTVADAGLAERYDAAEAGARQAGKGIWAAFAEPPPPPPAPPPPTRQEQVLELLETWQAGIGSLVGVLVVGILILIAGRARPRQGPPRAMPASTKPGTGIE